MFICAQRALTWRFFVTVGIRTGAKACGALLVAGSLFCALLQIAAQPTVAKAGPVEELQAIQEKIRQGNKDYEEATARVEDIQKDIDANEKHIVELEAELPGAREQAALSMRTNYKLQQSTGGILSLLLSSEDFYDLLTTIQYLDVIQEHNNEAVDELLAMADDLEATRVSLNTQMQEAEEAQAEVQDALDAANAAREELYAEIRAQEEAEAAQRRAAIEAAKRKQEEQKEQQDQQGSQGGSFATESGNQSQVQVPVTGDPGAVDMGSDKQKFVSEWTQRLDAYLAGSPLAGQGKTFAEAAWEFGVDPRLSPAISTVESSTGRVCFLPHNAWGWGASSWSSWEEAIWDHVEGLAIGYGGQLTYAGAQKYCPPNADLWYASVLANMESM